MSQHQSLTELYREMCVRFRELAKMKQEQTRKCVHCEKLESSHDPRCTSYVCTTKFYATTQDEEDRLAQSLELVEKLAKLNKWGL